MTASFGLILFSIACGVVGQLTLKTAMNQIGRIGAEMLAQPVDLAFRVASNPLVIGGLSLYAVSAVAWLTVLSRVPLSFAYPMLALSYILIPILAWVVLGESVPAGRWFGIAAIFVGLVLVSRA